MAVNLQQFGQTAAILAPIVLSALGQPQLASLVQQAIQTAEQAFQKQPKTGAEKKALALQFVHEGLQALEVVKPGTLEGEQEEIEATVSEAIDVVVAAINIAETIRTAKATPAA